MTQDFTDSIPLDFPQALLAELLAWPLAQGAGSNAGPPSDGAGAARDRVGHT